MVLRLSELYVSTQGEGPRVGLTTQFARFGGCNLRCPGWPCDTQHAIDPKYRNEWEHISPRELLWRIQDLREQTGATNICFTGGEPFLQPHTDLETLTLALVKENFQVECFSNGTLPYPDWAMGIKFVMDWKLPGSGEWKVGGPIRWKNLAKLNKSGLDQAIKFVLKDTSDLDIAHKTVYEQMINGENIHNVQVFYGRVWQSKWTDADMIAAVLERKLPWRLNLQVHNYIWDPHERAR